MSPNLALGETVETVIEVNGRSMEKHTKTQYIYIVWLLVT